MSKKSGWLPKEFEERGWQLAPFNNGPRRNVWEVPYYVPAAYVQIEELLDEAGIPETWADGEPHYLHTRVKLLIEELRDDW